MVSNSSADNTFAKPFPLVGATNGKRCSTADILIIGIGTAGVGLCLMLMKRYRETGCLGQVQSFLAYDLNLETLKRVRRLTKGLASIGIYLPKFVPQARGFLWVAADARKF